MDDEKRLTPMLAQYRQIKARYPDALVLFRLGDFYETFEADAKTAARELELALTARTFAKGVRLPMAGVPHHHVQAYIAKLIEKGYKVALVEQLEDPKKVRKLVKRDVVRLITPGTVVEDALLQAKRENYLAAIVRARRSRTHPDEADTAFGLALIDISTGEFATTQIEDPGAQTRLLDELQRVQASEFVLPQSLTADEEFAALIGALGAARISTVPDPAAEARRELLEHFHTTTLAPFGCEELPLAAAAAGLALRYLKSNQPNNENGSPLAHLNHLWTFSLSDTMTLDAATRRNLELTAPMQPADGVETFRRQTPAARSLFSVLDQTLTAMGARLLKRWIQQPLLDADLINARLDAVEELHRDVFLREDVRKLLDGLYDVERLVGRIGFGTAGARDLNALKRVLRRLPAMKALLARAQCAPLRGLGEQLDELQDVAALIDGALVDDPPSLIKEGGLIKRSYHAPLDELRERAAQGSGWLKALEETERQSTGIKSLRVRYNEVFGFFIEAPRSAAHLIPKHYERRATISHAERYVTPELKAQEAAILATADRIKDLEYELFVQLRRDVAQHSARLQAAARMLAQLDALAALAEAAARFHYVRPVVDDGDRIEIREGRHPVVERHLRDGESFVPNDTRLDGDTHRVLILTGPNMSGKSVFVRQVALIVLMAQMGSFVPASFAQVGLVDRIFTRVGASDDIAQGRSTFLVEMNEASHILRHASARSLLVLDEVGRGTSTYDGISLAWAIAEEIHNQLGAKTLFATHFHELTQLASAETITAHGGAVKNYTMAIKERGHEVVFLRQVIEGAAEKSFGIHVAQMAGLHPRLITRAQEILRGLEQSREPSAAQADAAAQQQRPEAQTALAVVREERALYEARRALWRAILRELAQVDVANMTPVQALVLLNEVKLKLSADAGAAQTWDSA
ncbi:MAG: DNA mismatch repair protein MutS [Chloroflexi bacterium]|nr:DNA mismatch repair protein MutS [Chloroflexota bacterium]